MYAISRARAAWLLKKPRHSSLSPIDMRRRKKSGSFSTYYSNDLASLRPPTRLENTYQLGPRRMFPVEKVQLIIKQTLERYLEHEVYSSHVCALMSKKLSEIIRTSVKELFIPRYKLVCFVHIGQLGDQSMCIASRCLWDSSCDTFASVEFRNKSLFAICTVYAVYMD